MLVSAAKEAIFMLEVDLFWSFRSPYSYLATPRLVRLAEEYEVAIHVRPVLPLAVRDPDFFKRVNPLWPPYLLRDTTRIAQYLGLDYAWPRPDPVVQDFTTGRVAAEQPYIHRLTRLGVEAERRGFGLSFLAQVSRVIWSGKITDWHEGPHLAEATARAGLDLREMEMAVATAVEEHDRVIQENQEALQSAGHWGVPTMVFEGEPFFGQDRIDLLVWRMKARGLEPRGCT
jgi:2-hydroxychromene-2-carboxylate isomerase